MSSGITCAVVSCRNNSRKLKVLSETSFVEHQQLTNMSVPCDLHTDEGGNGD